jgi:type IV pilus assembly protein PilC
VGFAFTKSCDLALFARQFSVMLGAGVPLVQCLSVLIEQQENTRFKMSLLEVRAEVEAGSTLVEALMKHPRLFNRFFTQMIAAGEAGGFLDVVLQRLSVYIQRAAGIRRQVLSASAYPVVVAGVAVITLSLTLIWVVPVFTSLFEQMDAPLPLPTQGVIVMSQLAKDLWIPSVFLVCLGIVGLYYLRRSGEGRFVIDKAVLGLPLLGKILVKIAVARFALTLATLLRSGVPVVKGLEITAACSGNSVFERAIGVVREDVIKGRSLSQPMEEVGVFPPLVTRMIAVGEKAGELDQMLEHLSSFYEEDSEATVNQLMTALEPSLVVILGVLVGGIVFSMYLPVFSLVGHFAR